MRVEALSANPAVLTCLANDIGYEQIYAEQLRVKANSGDVLIVFSGSGNSPNIIKALEMGNSMGMKLLQYWVILAVNASRLLKHPSTLR